MQLKYDNDISQVLIGHKITQTWYCSFFEQYNNFNNYQYFYCVILRFFLVAALEPGRISSIQCYVVLFKELLNSFLYRAPSLASFAESISSIEEESEENLWRILPEQRDYYTKQFQKLQPVQDGLVKGRHRLQTLLSVQVELFVM